MLTRAHLDEFAGIAAVPPGSLIALFGLHLAAIVCNGLYIRNILRAYHVGLDRLEWLSLTVVTTATNLVSPFRGGAAARAVYLKAHHEFSYSDFLSTLSGMYLVYAAVHGVVGGLGIALLAREGVAVEWPLAALFLCISLAAATLLTFRFDLPDGGRFPLRQLARVLNGWALLRRDTRLLASIFALNALYLGISVALFRIALTTYGVNVSLGGNLLYAASQGIAALVTLTPGALGIQEAMAVYVGRSLAFSPADALMAQALVRFVLFATLLVAAPLALRYLAARTPPETVPGATDSQS